jgi:hypothetical protein
MSERETALMCVTCKQPILPTETKWNWCAGSTPEHDQCYRERFAKECPYTTKASSDGPC